MKQTIFLSIILSFLSWKNEKVLANDISVNGFITPRVVGGQTPEIDTCKYQAQLRYRGVYFCPACIIDEDELLTTAHCFTNHGEMRPPYEQGVTAHTDTLSSTELGRVHRVERVTIHPGFEASWESSMRHDLAHVWLADNIEYDDNTQPADLPTHDVENGSSGLVSGWGRTDPHIKGPAPFLQILRMKIIDYMQCKPHMVKEIFPEQLCAFHSPGHGCAKGDSGAPLVRKNVIIGIHSWTRMGMCAQGKAEVFTNVYAERAFIDSMRNPSGYKSNGQGRISRPQGRGMEWQGPSGGSGSGRKKAWWQKMICNAQ